MLIRLNGSGLLHVQLYRALRAAILGGKLPPGARLPSTRALAHDSGVARNTVLLAYARLLGEGYAVTRRGSGTYVPAELPDDMTAVARASDRRASPARSVVPRLSRLGRTIKDWDVDWRQGRSLLRYDFRYGRPAFADFPHATWRRLLGRRARHASEGDLDYGAAAGVPALRDAVAGYLQRSRAVVCAAEQVLIVNGSQQALDLAAKVLLDPGDRVLLEEPCYAGALGVFVAAGAEALRAPVDAEGLDVAAVGNGAPRIRLAYVTPSHQFPTGVVMSLKRRLALLSWAERANAYVLEDDYDSEYRYTGRPVESLQGIDQTGRVIYLGTFSKLMFPALRLGYLVLPPLLVKPFHNAKALTDTGTATLEQSALADFIRAGHFERHIRRSRVRNAARRAALLEAIAEHLGDRVEVSGGGAGIHVLLWLRDVPPHRLGTCIKRARAAGVGIYSAASCFRTPPPRAGIILGYNALSEADIRAGIQRLATVLAPGAHRLVSARSPRVPRSPEPTLRTRD